MGRPESADGSGDVSLDPVDEALAAALSGPLPDEDDAATLTLPELAERSGLSLAVLEAVAREGLLAPQPGTDRYAAGDVAVVRAGVQLLEAGLPLGEFLDLARRTDQALRDLADHAVETFLRFVRDPVRGTSESPDEAARHLVTAFTTMLPATGELVGSHFRRLVLVAARARLRGEADDTAS
jgi:hypothetical protein